ACGDSGQPLGAIQVGPDANDQAVAELVQERGALVDVGSAARPSGRLVHEREHPIAEITHLLDLEAMVRHRLLKACEVRGDLLATMEDRCLREGWVLHELDVGGDIREEGPEITTVERLPRPAHRVYVLLGHGWVLPRPRSAHNLGGRAPALPR